MESGFSFFKSPLARRFCLLFTFCAFIPTVVLIVFSYGRVVDQLEEQSFIRLQREVKAYGLSLFDRMIRINNELRAIGRAVSPETSDFSLLLEQHKPEFGELFQGVAVFSEGEKIITITGEVDGDFLRNFIIAEKLTKNKPFILSKRNPENLTDFYFCANIRRADANPYTVVAKVRSEYLWGFGAAPILPPLTELAVFDKNGQNIVSTIDGFSGDYRELKKRMQLVSPRVFTFELDGESYHAGMSNLFVESRFQSTGWVIIISRARNDIMSAIDNFKRTFPFIILFFLVLMIYLSIMFIKKGLDPLAKLKEGTKRIGQRDFSHVVDVKSGDEFEELSNSFNGMASMLDKQFSAMQVLADIDRSILASLDRVRTIETALQKMKEFFGCTTSHYVKIAEDFGGRAKVYSLQERRITDPKISYYPLGEEDELILLGDEDVHFSKFSEQPPLMQILSGESDETYLCLPLTVDGVKSRALLLGRLEGKDFNEDELNQARKIANQLAIGLSNSILLDNMEKLTKGTIEALARTVDAKSRWTSGHSERVAEFSGKIARAMGLNEKDIELIIRAGLLHDIGKIGVPISILDKPSKLNDEEYAKVQEHPQIGADILEPIHAYQDILPIVAQHHEKYDGTGYPNGLAGDDIDLRARIMAVADVWDALVSDRPYRGGWVTERATNLILGETGKHFDPKVVDAFLMVTAEE